MTETTLSKKAPARAAAGPLTAQIARLISKALAESLGPLGLAPAQLMVLRELWRKDGRTQSELAQKLEVEQATMSNTLKRMARDGLVRDEPHASDSRARLIRLTERSALLEAPAKAVVKEVHGRAFAGLTRKEQKRFVELAARVVATLKGEAGPPSSDT